MTTAHDPAECKRLAVWMRRLADAPGPGDELVVRPSLRSAADQLEAACAEAAELRHRDQVARQNVEHLEILHGQSTAERDQLRAEVAWRGRMLLSAKTAAGEYGAERDALRADLVKAKDEHTSDGLAWFEREHALTMERDSLRQRIAELERVIDVNTDTAVRALADAQARVAELEERLKGAEQEVVDVREQVAPLKAQEMIITLQIQLDDATHLLRAIRPVYRAAVSCRFDESPHLLLSLWEAIDTARSALTPDLLAAAERAGLEVTK